MFKLQGKNDRVEYSNSSLRFKSHKTELTEFKRYIKQKSNVGFPWEAETTRRRDENKPTQLAYDTNSNRALIGEVGLTCDAGLLQKGSIRLHQPPFGARSSVTERTSSLSLQVALYAKWRTLILCAGNKTGSGRAFSGFGIWPKYGAGIGNTISILTGSGI